MCSSNCVGMTPFLSWEAANKVLQSKRRFKQKQGRGKTVIYRCRSCPHWHIGSAALA